jgi:hypothetical protein
MASGRTSTRCTLRSGGRRLALCQRARPRDSRMLSIRPCRRYCGFATTAWKAGPTPTLRAREKAAACRSMPSGILAATWLKPRTRGLHLMLLCVMTSGGRQSTIAALWRPASLVMASEPGFSPQDHAGFGGAPGPAVPAAAARMESMAAPY